MNIKCEIGFNNLKEVLSFEQLTLIFQYEVGIKLRRF